MTFIIVGYALIALMAGACILVIVATGRLVREAHLPQANEEPSHVLIMASEVIAQYEMDLMSAQHDGIVREQVELSADRIVHSIKKLAADEVEAHDVVSSVYSMVEHVAVIHALSLAVLRHVMREEQWLQNPQVRRAAETAIVRLQSLVGMSLDQEVEYH